MTRERVSLLEARETVNHLVQGVDPYTGEITEEDHFLQNPRMIRCFAVISDMLTKFIENDAPTGTKEKFQLNQSDIDLIEFPEGEIGVMKLISSINKVIDTYQMKKLSAFALNRKLIEEGILSYSSEEGSKKAVVNDHSGQYGITSIKATFNGEEYYKVVYLEEGKQYVLNQLLKWFG